MSRETYLKHLTFTCTIRNYHQFFARSLIFDTQLVQRSGQLWKAPKKKNQESVKNIKDKML